MGLLNKSIDPQQQNPRTPGQTSTMSSSQHGYGATTWAPPYDTPIQGIVDGTRVSILQVADAPGFSPVQLCVDDQGNQALVRLRDVTITDPRFLPLNTGQSRQ